MKKITTLLLVLCCSALSTQGLLSAQNSGVNQIFIQQESDNRNELSLQIAGYELLLETMYVHYDIVQRQSYQKRTKYSGRIKTFEFGFNGYTYAPNADYSMYPEEERGFMDLSIARSGHYTFNLFTFSTALVRSHRLGVTIGVGLTVNDYTLETPVRFEKIDGILRPASIQTNLKKSKLNTVALHIPLALEFNPTRKFFISAGGYFDLMLESHTKSKFPKEKVRGAYTNFVQAGVTVRVGFKNLYLFGNYGLTKLFRQGKGPGVNPYSFGIGSGF